MSDPFKRILVTAALPYANGYLHLGHLAGAYLPADLYVRYQRLQGRDILFLCGSDEHGVAITVTAEQEGITPREVIDRYHPENEATFRKFGMSFDHYSRTSVPVHHETVQTFFRNLNDRSLLRKKEEQQLYCEKDRMFLADRYVEGICPKCGYEQARGDQCENCGTWLNQTELIKPKCKLCGTTPVVRSTTHLYFPLGAFQKRLEAYIDERHRRDGWRETVLRYCRSWFTAGLEDRAVTRDLQWGVRVPVEGFEEKVIYVWFDALLGYVTAAKEWAVFKGDGDAWKRYWQDPETKYVAFIGKDNVVFHCIVFPAMLMGWNDCGREQYVLPENVPANEFLNFEGQKFSKSRGWGIDARDFLERFPADFLRYALAVTLPESRDADFTLKDFQARVNNELADILGNFVNRTMAFAHRSFAGTVPPRGPLNALDTGISSLAAGAPAAVGSLFDRYRLRDAVTEAMNLARAANKYFNDSEPWKTVRTDPARCATTINVALQVSRTLAVLLEPVVPRIARNLWTMLNLPGEPGRGSWETAGEPALKEGHRLRAAQILVSKIEDKQIDSIMQTLLTASEGGFKPTISLEDFQKIDLRLAKVLEADRIPKSDKLLKLVVEMGTERRQIVAGIGKQYEPGALIGKTVVVVANLQPARLMGSESQGMLLAANAENGGLAVVTVADDLPSGTVVR